jgi:hypothetical protein
MKVVDRLRCDIPADWSSDFSQCLYEWQGLEGGLLALAAAGLGAVFLWRQITQSERHEYARLRREHNAVRATLPLTLSGLVESLRAMLLALHSVKAEVRVHGFTTSFSPPPIPVQHVVQLQSLIRSSDAIDVIEPISEIIRQIQTLWARVEVLMNPNEQKSQVGLDINIDDWIIQAAKIHALVESLFDYARSETERGPQEVAWQKAESIIFHLRIESSELAGRIKSGIEKSPNFWTID